MNAQPDIEFRDVTVRYGAVTALEHVSFSITRGGFWGVIGPNGSGKSTLVRAVVGLVRPESGEVRVFGTAPENLGAQRARLGYVPQYAALDFTFPLRVLDVVAMGLYGRIGLGRRLTRAHRDAAQTALDRVGLADLASRHIGSLSGGQRQRVLIARALVVQPDILLLDEPTAALDVSSSEGLYEWLHGLHGSMTIVLVSHDVGVVSRYVDAVACLNRTLVAHGRPQDVLAGDTVNATYGCGAVLFGHGDTPHMVVDHADHSHAHSHEPPSGRPSQA